MNTDYISLQNEDSIESVNVVDRKSLKELILVNLINLVSVFFYGTEDLVVKVINCPNLKYISNIANKNVYSKSLYLGENLDSLENIDISYFRTVIIKPVIFENLYKISFNYIDRLLVNFTKFDNLVDLSLNYCKVPNIIISSDIIRSLGVNNCKVNYISLQGFNNRLIYLSIRCTVFEDLFCLNNLSGLFILKITREGHKFPYLPLPDNNIDVYVETNTSYHRSLEPLISSNDIIKFYD